MPVMALSLMLGGLVSMPAGYALQGRLGGLADERTHRERFSWGPLRGSTEVSGKAVLGTCVVALLLVVMAGVGVPVDVVEAIFAFLGGVFLGLAAGAQLAYWRRKDDAEIG